MMKGSRTEQYEGITDKYAERGYEGSNYLVFRDLPGLLREHVTGIDALDFGCGAGRSTRFLADLGFNVTGVDLNQGMIREAKSRDNQREYIQLQDYRLPFPDDSFDLVYSQFVFFEISTKKAMIEVLTEHRRVLRDTGAIVIVTGTPELSQPGNWVSVTTDFPENNKDFASGDRIKKLLLPQNVLISDVHWSKNDYREAVSHVGLKLVLEVTFEAKDSDPIEWKDELRVPPFMAYIVKLSRAREET